MSTPSLSLRTRGRRLASRRGAVMTPARRAVVSAIVPPSPAPALRVEGLCRTDGDRLVFDDLHLEVAPGERIALLGTGKSALLDAIRADGPGVTIGGDLRLADDADGGGFEAPGSERADRPAVVLEVHDLDRALAGADRIIVLGQGRVLHQLHLGSGSRDLTDPGWIALRTRLAAAVGPSRALAA